MIPLALALSLATAPLHAQQTPVPQLDVTVIQQDSASTAGSLFVPGFALLMLLLVLSDTGGGVSYMY